MIPFMGIVLRTSRRFMTRFVMSCLSHPQLYVQVALHALPTRLIPLCLVRILGRMHECHVYFDGPSLAEVR